jgi:hypothetical protein
MVYRSLYAYFTQSRPNAITFSKENIKKRKAEEAYLVKEER